MQRTRNERYKETGHPIEIMKAYYISSTVSNAEQSIGSLNYIGYRAAQFLCHEMETSWYTFVKLKLDMEMYEPAQFPMEVRLSYEKKRGSDKKSLCARINTHPEMDGKYSKGKIFFPDKS